MSKMIPIFEFCQIFAAPTEIDKDPKTGQEIKDPETGKKIKVLKIDNKRFYEGDIIAPGIFSRLNDDQKNQISYRMDLSTQNRAGHTKHRIQYFADNFDKLPPIDAFWDGSRHWMGDGWGRLEAAILLKKSAINANIHPGGQKEAALFGIQTNKKHDESGTPRTPDDLRAAISLLLTHPEWAPGGEKWSNREVSRLCDCSHTLVNELASDLNRTKDDDERTYRRKGKTFKWKRYPKKKQTSVAEQLSGMSPAKQKDRIDKDEALWATCPMCHHKFKVEEQ